MIIEYHRPDDLSQALKLLSRTEPLTVPMGGGTVLTQKSAYPFAVVDLQSLGLNSLEVKGNWLIIGATVTLQQLLAFEIIQALKVALRHEATYNIRQVATIVGTLVAASGRSPLTTTLLALDAELDILPNDQKTSLGSFLLQCDERKPNQLITHVKIPSNTKVAYEYVARTPADLPVVCAAVVQWPSGRVRVTLGGFGSAPMLVMDGPEADGAETAAREAYREAGDQWASAAYRSDIAGVLVKRCIEALSN